MTLRDYLHTLRRRWKLVTIVVLCVLAGATVYLARAVPQYESRTELFIATQASTSDNAYSGSQFATQRVVSYAGLATGPDIAELVIEELGLQETPAELAARVSAEALPETVVLGITVTDPDPEQAREIAAEYATQMRLRIAELETPPGQDNPLLKATIVRTAQVADAPASPDVLRIAALALVLGLLLGFGLAVLRELLDTTVKSNDDLAEETDAPVLGRIHNDPIVPKQPLLTQLTPHHPRTEAFRVLRTNLEFVDVDSADKSYVITSAVSGEGKSSTAVNTAIALAHAGKRVLLVDADLRRPRVATLLGLDAAVGLTSVLVGKIDWKETVQKHDSGLSVIASGPVPPNPAELLQTHAMADLIATLRQSWDLVVFDAPPLLPVADAAILASKTDGAIVVVRHGKTTRDQLRGAVERLEHVEAKLLGLVLNRVPRKQIGAGYGYGYGYGYAPDVTQGRRKRTK